MRALVLAALILLAGCANPSEYRWSRPGATQAELDRDDARCRNEGMAIAGINPAAYAGQAFQNCMRANGWTLRGMS